MTQPKRIDALLGRAALATSALAVLALLLVSSSSPAHADYGTGDARWFEVPDVAHRSEADAMRTLEGLGLTCRREDVASTYVGQVISTVPAAGGWIDRGREVVLRVGVPIRVQTIVPRVRRRSMEDLLSSLGDIYAIAVNPVRGPAHHEGRIVAQHPRAGAQLPFRGLLTVDVVDNHTTVPFVEGLGLRRALRRLERAGLRAKIREVPRADVDRPRVIRQRARAGQRVPFGAEVRLRVAVPVRHHVDSLPWHGRDPRLGRPITAPRQTVVPNVLGLQARQAAQVLSAAGLVADWGRRGAATGVVHVQVPTAGTPVAPGTAVKLRANRRFGDSGFGWGRVR